MTRNTRSRGESLSRLHAGYYVIKPNDLEVLLRFALGLGILLGMGLSAVAALVLRR